MSRKMVSCLVLILLAMLAEALCRIGAFLPWREYCAECELCHEQRNKGVIYQSFGNGRRDVQVYEYLQKRRGLWNAPAFRTNLMANAVCPERYWLMHQCLLNAEVEVRAKKSCVLVRTRSAVDAVAVECANAIADGIAADFSTEETIREQQVVKQMKINLEKHIKRIGLLEGRLGKGRGSDIESIEAIENELASERELIKAMQSQIGVYAHDGLRRASMKRVSRAEDHLSLVPPNRMRVFCWTFATGLAVLLLAFVLGRFW